MRGVKEAVTTHGTVICACPGCGSNPIRSHPHMETLDVEQNWTRTCMGCGRKLCLVCYPVAEPFCLTCGHPTPRDELLIALWEDT